MTDINVAFTSTNYGPMWAPAVESWLRVVGYTARHFEISHLGKIAGACITDRMYTMSAENALAESFMDNPDFTHLFMTESDMILPKDCIVKLAALDKDMASGVYFLRSPWGWGRGQPCLYKKAPAIPVRPTKDEFLQYQHTPVSLFPRKEPFRVDCAGLGCVLIKRKVFENLPKPWFDLKAGTENQIGYGSDIYFYTKTRRAGHELWVDPTVQCGQIDYYETTLQDYEWQVKNDPHFAGRGFIIGLGGDTNGSEKPATP